MQNKSYKQEYLREKAAKERAEALLASQSRKLIKANTDLQAKQKQLIQSEKMASLGQLSAGIAHELNNPISFSISNIRTLNEYLDSIIDLMDLYKIALDPGQSSPDIFAKIKNIEETHNTAFITEDIRNLIEETTEGMERVRSIVAGLKVFSHAEEDKKREANVNELVKSGLKLVTNTLKYKCSITENLQAGIEDVRCHPNQITQILVNLLENASHAIDKNGTVTINTWADKNFAYISVNDNGHGINEADMKKIFTPFFTTKPVGKGTGLGLSVAYGIMESHGGTINVKSKEGVGTTFTLQLPFGSLKKGRTQNG